MGFGGVDISTSVYVKPKSVDRSHHVVVFGVPEIKTLLDTESLVCQAFEFCSQKEY